MEYTEDEILEVVSRWENSGLLYGLPLYEKQELAPIYDNVARLAISKLDKGLISREVSDLLDNVMFPICRRLYRRVGSDFEVERMIENLIKEVNENKDKLNSFVVDKTTNPIVEFCVTFADGYEDETISNKQFSDEEYIERVDKVLDTLRHILLNKDMVSFVDRTNSDWKIMLSDAKKSSKQVRYWNQKICKEFLSQIMSDTNKAI
jgi:hypothetical protein